MSELEALLKEKVAEINRRSNLMSKVTDWIDGYSGKIIELRTKAKTYHLVFTKAGVSLREGEYPSVELTYHGEEEALVRLIRGESSTREEVRKGKLKTWHNLHEALKFEEVFRF